MDRGWTTINPLPTPCPQLAPTCPQQSREHKLFKRPLAIERYTSPQNHPHHPTSQTNRRIEDTARGRQSARPGGAKAPNWTEWPTPKARPSTRHASSVTGHNPMSRAFQSFFVGEAQSGKYLPIEIIREKDFSFIGEIEIGPITAVDRCTYHSCR